MKLVSKEMCPTTVRDRLVKNLAGQDVAVCDIKRAVEWAEAKCLELNKENEELEQYVAHAKNKINELNKELEVVYKKNNQ